MVGREPLKLAILVRIQVPQQRKCYYFLMNTQHRFSKIYTIIILIVIGLGCFYMITAYNKTGGQKKGTDSYRDPIEKQILEDDNESNNSKDVKISTKTLENIVTPAYIVLIEDNKVTLDYFEALSGDVAKKAAIEDGRCTQKEIDEHNGCFPNGDIYDRNKNSKLRTFELSPNVTITTASAFSTVPSGIKNISVTELKRDYIRQVDGKTISPPYMVTIKNSVVTEIVEIFRP